MVIIKPDFLDKDPLGLDGANLWCNQDRAGSRVNAGQAPVARLVYQGLRSPVENRRRPGSSASAASW